MNSKKGTRGALGSARSNATKSETVNTSTIQAHSLQAAREQNAYLAKKALKKAWKCPACEVDNQPGRRCRMCPFNWDDPGKVSSHPLEQTPFGFERVENKKKNKKKNKDNGGDASSRPGSASNAPQKPMVLVDLTASDSDASAPTLAQIKKEKEEQAARLQKEREEHEAQQKQQAARAKLEKKIRNELHLMYKVERCQYRSDNECPAHIWCHNYHEENTRRRDPRRFAYTADPCPATHADNMWYDASSCEKGDLCSMAHTELERLYHPQLYRLTLCTVFTERGSCGWRHLCSSAHGVDDMRDVSIVLEPESKRDNGDSRQYTSSSSSRKSRSHAAPDDEKSNGDHMSQSLAVPAVINLRAELDKLREEHARLQDELASKEQLLVQKVMHHMHEKDAARKAKFDEERRYLQKIVDAEEREHTKLSDRVICAICCDRDRNAAVIPCGHTFCQTCISRHEDRTCMLCNQQWFHVQALHL